MYMYVFFLSLCRCTTLSFKPLFEWRNMQKRWGVVFLHLFSRIRRKQVWKWRWVPPTLKYIVLFPSFQGFFLHRKNSTKVHMLTLCENNDSPGLHCILNNLNYNSVFIYSNEIFSPCISFFLVSCTVWVWLTGRIQVTWHRSC